MKKTIAINLGHKYVAITAELVTIHGLAAAVHRTLNSRNGWTVTHVLTGTALSKSSVSKAEALRAASSRIERAGVAWVIEKLADFTVAPDVDTLELIGSTPKKPAAKADVDHIVKLITQCVGGLLDTEVAAVKQALNSRTGQLKAKSPSAFGSAEDRLACAAWLGLQPNPFKLGMVSLFAIGHHAEPQSLFSKLSKHRWPAAFDRDKLALVGLGVW